jgi:hypothetical protein
MDDSHLGYIKKFLQKNTPVPLFHATRSLLAKLNERQIQMLACSSTGEIENKELENDVILETVSIAKK